MKNEKKGKPAPPDSHNELHHCGYKTIVFGVTTALFFLVAIEVFAQVMVRLESHHWRFKQWLLPHARLFEAHPWLLVAPKPNSSAVDHGNWIAHNSLGFRGDEIPLTLQKGQKRIICYGGSTTYCTQVSNNQTWPYFLGQALGTRYQVINAGIPGTTTAENVIQTALEQYDLKPAIAIYYEGWNDLQNVHVEGLQSDYSDFHARMRAHSIPVTARWSDGSAIVQIIAHVYRHLLHRKDPLLADGTISDAPDERAAGIYEYNLRTLVAICKSKGVRPIFIPQVVKYDTYHDMHDTGVYAWIPFIRDQDMQKFMDSYNGIMNRVCQEEHVTCINSVLHQPWTTDDFVDKMGHFSEQGSYKFARLVAQAIQNL